MSIMVAELYDALIAAGAPPEQARKAAETVAAYDDRLGRIERRLSVLSWQVTATSALVALIGAPSIWLLLKIAAKVGVG